MRCTTCNASVEGAGEGMTSALAQLDAAREKRIGTSPEKWRIAPVRQRRRKRR
jgi:hypothetical protein